MKKIFILGLGIAGFANAQTGNVGINTNNPQSTLEIAAKSPATRTEGVMIPRMTGDEIKNMPISAALHEGILVYATAPVTTANLATLYITDVGFYFLRSGSWYPLAVGEPWNDKNSKLRASNNTQDIYRIGKVAIGTSDDTTNSYLTVKGLGTDGMQGEIHMLNANGIIDFDYFGSNFGDFFFRNRNPANSSLTYFSKNTGTTATNIISLGHNGIDGALTVYGNEQVNNTLTTAHLVSQGSVVYPFKTVNVTPYTITDQDYTLRIYNGAGYIAIPSASTAIGRIIVLIGSNGIETKNLVTTDGGIYDDVTKNKISTISTNERITIQSDGTGWIVIAR